MHMSRNDCHQSANSVSDSERGAEAPIKGTPIKEEKHEDTPPAGDHGRREVELAEGYPSQPPTTASDVKFAGAGDDPYAGYDPGMAGCTTEQDTCHIAGLPWMGIAPPGPAHARPHPHARTESRGYERDEDEYAGSFASTTPEPASSAGPEPASGSASGPATAAVVAAAIDPAQVPLPDTDGSSDSSPVPVLVPATDPATEPGRPTPPSIGTRLVGRVERLAGKVFRDPNMEARGKRHMTGRL